MSRRGTTGKSCPRPGSVIEMKEVQTITQEREKVCHLPLSLRDSKESAASFALTTKVMTAEREANRREKQSLEDELQRMRDSAQAIELQVAACACRYLHFRFTNLHARNKRSIQK